MDWYGGEIVILCSKDFSYIWLQEIQSNREEKSVSVVVSATHFGIENPCTQSTPCAVELHERYAFYATDLMNKHFHCVYFMNLMLPM